MGKIKDLTGQKFNRLTVIKRVGANKWRQSIYLCQCDCGNTVQVVGNDLKNGHTTSCGCSHSTQSGLSMQYPRLYNIWRKMIDRCNNPKCSIYKHYGERGITVCSEWLNFETFIGWALNNGYTDNLTLDRINFDGNYEPNNCRWLPIQAQQNNKRNNHKLTYKGITKTIREWEQHLGLPKDVINQRINKLGWTIEQALEIPLLR